MSASKGTGTSGVEAEDLQSELVVSVLPGSVEANFEYLEAALDARLEEYKTIVTGDRIPDARRSAAEVNALKKRLNERRRAVLDELSAPAKAFDARIRALTNRCEEVRQEIMAQIAAFDDRKRAEAADHLEREREQLWNAHEVDDSFRRAEYADLAIASAVTPKGKLTRSAYNALLDRVMKDVQLQRLVRQRALELENRCYRSGLSEPLSVDHVWRVIEADDATYDAEVDRLIGVEKDRQERMRDHARRQAERENRERQEREAAERARAADAEASAPTPEPPPAPDPDPEPAPAPEPASAPADGPTQGVTIAPDELGDWIVEARFRVHAAHVSQEDLEREIRRVLVEDAFLSDDLIVSVRAWPDNGEAS